MGYKSFSNTNFPAVMSLSVIKDTDIYVHNGHGMEGGMAFIIVVISLEVGALLT